ncbi:hypothetical protein X798_06119 [Onchocerca flexuosa]|uniref:Uncharacterized protein n=2 Tax=Onchocerca flexuosa TaxID=387005 RepID=A0A183HEW3_9BILA|nr:hypothetical protein X798_06119 [Onchocerca flexuosa]VDO45138.1 unnamed protein product [Onchocerca flexuosa]
MHNGVGLQTARGSDTNRFVQAIWQTCAVEETRGCNSEAELNEPKLKLTAEQRIQVAYGELDMDAEMDNRDTHVYIKAAMKNRVGYALFHKN